MLTCPTCGSEEPEGSRFCGACGVPLVAADPPADHAAPTPVELIAPASTDAPTEVVAPPAWPQAPPSDPAPLPPSAAAAAAAPVGPRRRARPFVLIAALLVLIAAGAAAVLVGTNAIGGTSGKSESAFVLQVSENVLGRLGQADQTAAEHASTTDAAFARAADGGRIVQAADQAAVYLRALSGLSGKQQGQVQLLLAFVGANERYGRAFAAFEPTNTQSQFALDGVAAVVRAAIPTVQSGLPADLQLPSEGAFISAQIASPPPPSATTTTTPAAPDVSVAYVQQVDDLLNRSHAVVLALRSFVPRATSDAITRSNAVATARSYVDQRRLELEQAQALAVPPAFAPAQALLIRSLQASVADDEALVAWTVARRDGSGNAQAALDQANRIGARATALKQQFLQAYGAQRQAATSRSPASLPDIF